MLVKCNCCLKEFNKVPSAVKKYPNNYCSRSCAAIINNAKAIKRNRTKKCKTCDNLIRTSRRYCDKCSEYRKRDITLREILNQTTNPYSLYANVRHRARNIAKNLGWKSCIKCGYDKHIEIAHVKPISSFDMSTLVSVINDESNLLPLCPNCHWEHDNLKC